MREIKFRGKLLHSKQWIEGNLIIANNGQPYIIPSDILEVDGHHLRIDSDNPFWVLPETVGQFTGSYDKNEKDCYYKDIVNKDGKIGIIEWDNIANSWCIYIPFLDIHCQLLNGEYEVIGNIHDNPELIKD